MGTNTFSQALVTSLFATFGVLAAGCSSTHSATTVSSGIYDLTVARELDACSPSRATGRTGAVGVVATDDVVNVGAIDGTRISLSQANGFHGEFEAAIPACPTARLRREWTILGSSAEGFTMAYAETWSGLDGCGAVAMPSAPSHDCRADLVLDYRRTTACEAPCEVSLDASGPSCSCR